MTADAGLGALTDLDLDGGTAVQVLGVHAEASRGDLDDDVVLVGIEVRVQSALAGVHEDAERSAAIASDLCTLSETEP